MQKSQIDYPSVVRRELDSIIPVPPSDPNRLFGPFNNNRLLIADTTTPGPNSTTRLWHWVVYVVFKPGFTLQYQFDFVADYQNEIVIYDYKDDWSRVDTGGRINNYNSGLSSNILNFTNDSSSDMVHVLTAWNVHIRSSSSHLPWGQDPTYYYSDREFIYVTFADDWWDPPYTNAVVKMPRGSDHSKLNVYYHSDPGIPDFG